MSSPAERPQAARRQEASAPASPAPAPAGQLAAFTAGLDFPLDEFQRTACESLERGNGVLVCAPTGAGKTVVGEFAVHLALASDAGKCFYTTPIKALSNQKYHDLLHRYGPERVGLLTGDNSINPEAPVVVMTTEVLRNMLYAGSPTLAGLSYVVMDEVHYLADRFRGGVWEEVIIHLPDRVALVSLSATVSNAEEFAQWLITVRGHTEVVVSEHRPVPLWQHMLVGRRMFDLFHSDELNPELVRHTQELGRRADRGGADRGRAGRGDRGRGDRGRPGRGGGRWLLPYRSEVVERLDRTGLLPAIVFIFSRAGCDAAVEQCRVAGLRLTTAQEKDEIRRHARERVRNIPPEDLAVLGYERWLAGLERGLAAHHAGALPVFKEVVEELFVRGLIKVVFATETLSLGINMPARGVVLERLVKFDGESHVDLTPGEYTQLTGRAGRRGIDVEGHAVVVWSPEIDPRRVAGLASTRTYPLRSSFRPSYNMVVNLVGSLGIDPARELLGSSFAQFQADRAVVGITRQVRHNTEAIGAVSGDVACHLGDFDEYFQLRRGISQREKAMARAKTDARRAAARSSLEQLRVGDVIQVPSGRRAGLAVVLDPDTGRYGEPKPLVLTERRWAGRVPATDFVVPVRSLARVRVPRSFNHRSPAARRDLAASLRAALSAADAPAGPSGARTGEEAAGPEVAALHEELDAMRAALRQHPCHRCPGREEHARAAERRLKLEQDTDSLRQRASNRTGSLVRTFDTVCALLTSRGYLTTGGQVTEPGRMLSRIWTESDLLVAECLRRGVWDGLDSAELAAAVSVVVYEARRDEGEPAGAPRGAVSDAIDGTLKVWSELESDESTRGVALTRPPDPGFVWPIYRWARGEPLAQVLTGAGGFPGDLPAGDFVRWARQVVDLLGQIADAPGGSRVPARQAMGQISRGVVTHTV